MQLQAAGHRSWSQGHGIFSDHPNSHRVKKHNREVAVSTLNHDSQLTELSSSDGMLTRFSVLELCVPDRAPALTCIPDPLESGVKVLQLHVHVVPAGFVH